MTEQNELSKVQLIKQKIKEAEANHQKRIPVEVPEWNLTVYVNTLKGSDIKRLRGADFSLEYECYLTALATTDEDGNQIWTPEEIEELRQCSWSCIARLAFIATKLNKLDETELAEYAKNLDLG